MDIPGHLPLLSWLQTQPPDSLVEKGLESAVSFAQSMSQWAYLTIGASVALLLKDVGQRPRYWPVRLSFLLFAPGWALWPLPSMKASEYTVDTSRTS